MSDTDSLKSDFLRSSSGSTASCRMWDEKKRWINSSDSSCWTRPSDCGKPSLLPARPPGPSCGGGDASQSVLAPPLQRNESVINPTSANDHPLVDGRCCCSRSSSSRTDDDRAPGRRQVATERRYKLSNSHPISHPARCRSDLSVQRIGSARRLERVVNGRAATLFC